MRLALPDLLATRKGRLTAFFLLYVTEGIPLGFTATAIAAQMRRQGLGPAAIGAFVGSLYLPWAFKWAMGPFVDTISSDRFGRRRTWIFSMQILMIATLFVAMGLDFVHQIALFTAVIFVHNACAATMDVAIDALAVNVLPEHERGTANGFMFAGASIGQAIGGAGVLFLTAVMPFQSTYYFVAAAIFTITLFVVLPLRETAMTAAEAKIHAARNIAVELKRFVTEAWSAFTGSRAALVGVLAALLPAGAYALSLALQSNLAVELGLDDHEIAQLNLISTVIYAPFCILGGFLSDRFGRRRTLALFVFLTVLPTLWLAWVMWKAGWIEPVDINAPNRPHPSQWLLITFWAATIIYNIFQGLYYGIRTALYMDITTPAVAATQFTAYMALLNLCVSYTSTWQGWAVERIGYPSTLLLDSIVGLFGLLLLPLMRPNRKAAEPVAGATPQRPESDIEPPRMPDTSLQPDLDAWIGRTETRTDTIGATPLAALAATLDRDDPAPEPGTVVPPLWHWLYFLPVHRQSELGDDGHAKRGGFLPPVALPRRMWAGGRLTFGEPLRVGDAATRTSRIDAVTAKAARSGPLVFVTVHHTIATARGVAVEEDHDIVYRAPPAPGAAATTAPPAPDDAAFSRRIVADDVLLFRYSALTFNGHRIHYDRRYVTEVEGYPGLIVHGPLIATLLVDLLRREHPDAMLLRFDFKAVSPLFDLHPFTVCGRPDGDRRFALWARGHDGALAMQASAEIA